MKSCVSELALLHALFFFFGSTTLLTVCLGERSFGFISRKRIEITHII